MNDELMREHATNPAPVLADKRGRYPWDMRLLGTLLITVLALAGGTVIALWTWALVMGVEWLGRML